MFTGSYLHIAGGAVFTLLLVIGCVSDLASRRIPNALVIAILVTGWLFAVLGPDPGQALLQSVAGTLVGFGIWIAFYIVGAIGAGDVKFFAAAAAWLGPGGTWRAALVAAVIGGVLALVFLVMEKRLGATLRRMAIAASARTISVPPETPSEQGRNRPLPYGVALALGALVVAWAGQLS
ncbi:MAG TPA: prepilin peptidase [Gemmatimonadaceae bacterium]